jgi:predicted DNA-binding transcriptional regulator AlpA
MTESAKNRMLVQLTENDLKAIIRAEVTTAISGNSRDDGQLLDVDGAAKFVHQSKTWVYRNWQSLGGRKLGPKSLRFTKADLQKWINNSREGI